MTEAGGTTGNLLDKAFALNGEEVVARRIAGETILVPIRGNLADMQKIYVLDEVGEFILHKLDGRMTVREICEEVVGSFEVAADVALRDTKEFIAALAGEGLVVEGA